MLKRRSITIVIDNVCNIFYITGKSTTFYRLAPNLLHGCCVKCERLARKPVKGMTE